MCLLVFSSILVNVGVCLVFDFGNWVILVKGDDWGFFSCSCDGSNGGVC